MNLSRFLLIIIASLPFGGCKDDRKQPRAEEPASRPLVADVAYERLSALLSANETKIVAILHRNQSFMREDFEISPNRKASFDAESHRWVFYTRYGFFGIAEASCAESGGDWKIKITNTEDKPNWTEFLVPAKNESQQDGGGPATRPVSK